MLMTEKEAEERGAIPALIGDMTLTASEKLIGNLLYMNFYDNKNQVGNIELEILGGTEYYINYFETLIEGKGYARKMLDFLKEQDMTDLRGDVCNAEQESFWKHMNAKFYKRQFELSL